MLNQKEEDEENDLSPQDLQPILKIQAYQVEMIL